jgi:hypothetical protein
MMTSRPRPRHSALPRERWAHVGELMCTDSIDATASERQAVFARLTARRARKVDQQDVSILSVGGVTIRGALA